MSKKWQKIRVNNKKPFLVANVIQDFVIDYELYKHIFSSLATVRNNAKSIVCYSSTFNSNWPSHCLFNIFASNAIAPYELVPATNVSS